MAQASSSNIDTGSSLPPDDFQPFSPNTRRPFRREQSWPSPDPQYRQIDQDDQRDLQAEHDPDGRNPQGLGLTDVPLQGTAIPEIKRVPVGSRQHATGVDSPAFGGFSQTTTARNTSNIGVEAEEWQTPESSRVSFRDGPYRHAPSDVNLLPPDQITEGCPTHGDLLRTQWSGFTVMVLFLALFSTLFSAVFLVIALAKPRWGHRIGPRGALSYDSATLLSALLSKMVELTFATTYVVTLGQILTRRAIAKSHFSKENKGISIADMNMRLWIMQPGTLFTHWTGARYAVTTFLGISALIAAGATAFYTTAAESLVSPKLKFGRNETITMLGEVSASYGNVNYMTETCATPITPTLDKDSYGISCLQIDLAGNGFRNIDSWLSAWQDRAKSSESMSVLKADPRPPPIAVIFENTTVHGQWIRPSNENITHDSTLHGRLLQNVTLVMPHTNVLHAARSSRNQVLQPHDLQGAGEYYLKAAVPAPALNVLCAGVTEEEVAPMIANGTGTRPQNESFTTVLDDIFKWKQYPLPQGVSFNDTEYYAPWFDRLPKEFNLVANYSPATYGWTSVYVLGKKQHDVTTSDYVLCGIRSFIYSECSTAYHVAQSGGQLSVHCGDDPENWKPYSAIYDPKLDKDPFPVMVPQKDWPYLASEWVRAVGLSSGDTDSNSSITRLMVQTFPTWTGGIDTTVLSPTMPSIGEALGVLGSYTLLLSSDATSFVHYWDYANAALDQPAIANFTANLSYKDYASGGDQKWKGIFYVILFAAFLQNCFCLSYLLINYVRDGELTDYTEPQNLFALAMNSPQSHVLSGSCGGGPTGDVLGRKWCVNMTLTNSNNRNSPYGYEGGYRQNASFSHPHFYIRYPEEDTNAWTTSAATSPTVERSPGKSPSSKRVSWTPLLDMKRRRRSGMPRPKSMQDLNGLSSQESPAVAQYRRLIQ